MGCALCENTQRSVNTWGGDDERPGSWSCGKNTGIPGPQLLCGPSMSGPQLLHLYNGVVREWTCWGVSHTCCLVLPTMLRKLEAEKGAQGCHSTPRGGHLCWLRRVVQLHWEVTSQAHPLDAIPEQGRQEGKEWATWGPQEGPEGLSPLTGGRGSLGSAEALEGRAPTAQGLEPRDSGLGQKTQAKPWCSAKSRRKTRTDPGWGTWNGQWTRKTDVPSLHEPDLGVQGTETVLPTSLKKFFVALGALKRKPKALRGSTCCWVRVRNLSPSTSLATVSCVTASSLPDLSGPQFLIRQRR